MKKLALLLAMLMAVCSFSAITASADGLFVSAGTVTLPTEGDTDSMLIGWTYKDGSETVVLAPGSKFTAESDITLDPLYMDMDMAGGASVRTAEPAGLRFTTYLSEAHYQALTATGAEFELGTIIVPTDTIKSEFTYAAITAEGNSCLKIPCRIFWGVTETERIYTGVISNLHEDNYNRLFSARAYITVTYTDGTALSFYSDYDSSANSRSAYDVSCAALADSSSALSDDAKAVLQGYFDTVGIDLTYETPVLGGSPATPTNNIENGYYTFTHEWMRQYDSKVPTVFKDDSGYQLTITVNAKAGATITENTVLKLHGQPIKAKSYILEDGTLTIIRRHIFGDYTWGY